MKNIFLIVAFTSLIIGTAVFLYDGYFYLRYDADVNEVAAVANGGVADWPTGERPFYAFFPTWVYGIVFWLNASLFFITSAKAPRRTPDYIQAELQEDDQIAPTL